MNKFKLAAAVGRVVALGHGFKVFSAVGNFRSANRVRR